MSDSDKKGNGGNPRWRSGGAGGRSKRAGASEVAQDFAARVRELTTPDSLIQFMQEVVTNRDPVTGISQGFGVRERIAAATFLADRGWGKPVTTVQINATLTGRITSVVEAVDPRRLKDNELNDLERILSNAAGEPLLLMPENPIDVESTEK